MHAQQPGVPGGRFDFDDGGTYCGGWEDGKAHGHGVCTGPKSQGEYSGSWHFGFEVSGVYTWPSGSTYEGQWQNGKRHGLGVETRGRWTYRGEWTQGFKGRYGIRQSVSSGARYEGTWANGLQDGYGSETYADGGTFQGQWMRGMRHGYGVRASAAFGAASHHRPGVKGGSLSSLPEADPAADRDRRMDDCRGGFVLKSRSDEPPPRRRSLVERSTNLKKSILQGLKMKKQRSTGDIDRRGASSVRSSGSNLSSASSESSHSGMAPSSVHTDSNGSFVSQDELCDTAVTETYLGEWKNDRRCGFGIAERSDGLKYEGEWYNNKKYGYGVTTLKDGSREEGKYKNNVLVSSGKKKHLFMLRSAKFKERVDAAVNAAARASQIALQKADIAISRTATSRGKAEQADISAIHAQEDANIARHIAKQFDPDVKLPDMMKNSNPRLSMRVPFANLSNQSPDIPSRNESPLDPRMLGGHPPPPQQRFSGGRPDPYAPPPSHLDRFATPQQSHQQQLQYLQQQQQQQQMPYGQPPYANQTTQGYPPKPPQQMLQPQYPGYPPQDHLQQQQQAYQNKSLPQQYPSPANNKLMNSAYLGGDPPVVPNRQGSFRRRPSGGGGAYSLQQAMGDHFDHYRQEPTAHLRQRNVIKHGRRIPSPRDTPSLLYRGTPDATPDSGVSESMDGEESPARFGGSQATSLLSFAPSEEDSVVGRSPTASEVGADPAFPRTASLYVNPPSRRREAAVAASGKGGGGGGGGGGVSSAAEALRRKKSMPHGPKEMAAAAVPARVIPREEVAFLSSQRREEVRRIQYESERLRANPLLYLVRPDLKEWFSRQQMILLVLFINISLAVMFYKLLS